MKFDRKIAQKNFKENALNRAVRCEFKCQVCGKVIDEVTLWNFDHIETRNKIDKWKYENWFIFVCKNLHIYRSENNNNLENDPCVKFFLSNYKQTTKNFYSGYLEKMKHEFFNTL